MSSDKAGNTNNLQRNSMSVRDFTVVSKVGEGNMGKVYMVRMKDQTKPLAMKVMKKDDQRKHRLVRARKEAEILSVLDHPFLPSLVASFESDIHFFIVTKYCPGGDLNVLRQRQPRKRFSETAALFYAAEVLLALEHLHGIGIVYRDLKPENVLVQETGHILLTDFDLSLRLPPAKGNENRNAQSQNGCIRPLFTVLRAKKTSNRCGGRSCESAKSNPAAVSPGAPSQFQCFLGTEEYVAPEVLNETGHGFPLDWWTLGIFLYELVFGKTPFKGKDRNETFSNILNRKLPEFPDGHRPLYDLIARLLVKNPGRRLGSSPRDAEDIKRHSFFKPVRWGTLEHVSRPPFIPPPLPAEGANPQQEGLSIEDTRAEP